MLIFVFAGDMIFDTARIHNTILIENLVKLVEWEIETQ